ncbi:hypothetical protein HYPBUDRAFT_7067 [Hyphopichia burtonii NRRL Y-1933]|uniref:Protein kinase domain-containing protein n=1 Tax=Hyphopichia burtonii NRRL Y-1933 TaxID=984485 RepID=A0A1E4RHD4_9ASCO|nr:hypothetical protein HYPBUDRAFT_7067 [Hyphopichia burtonii NRRL Y-1933]ODV66682.1 hypothetical protein HYPBUDRAFT_7067 [Hyphopichia burtonii NRRL Y-1933]
MNSKYYAKILKSQGDELNEYDDNIPPEKLMEIFLSDNIVYVNYIPPDVMKERYRNQWYDGNQLNDHRLVYVSSISIAGYTSSERIEFIKEHELLRNKYSCERLKYINSVTPKLLEMMIPEERYEIKSKLISRIETSDEIDLPLLANTAFPFFTIQLALEFESIGINTFLSVHGSISNSRLSNFVFSFETELTDQIAVGLQGPGFSDLIKDGIDDSSDAFKSIIRQVGRYFIACNTTRAIVTNFHHSLFIEIGELSKELTAETEVVIPLRYRSFTLSSLGITVQAAFLAWLFFESAEEEKLHAERQKQTVSAFIKAVRKDIDNKSHSAGIGKSLARESNANSNINPQKSNSHVEGKCESWTGFEVLQGQGHRSHVYKFQVGLLCKFFPYFNEVLTGLNQDDLVVMKLFIPDVVARLDGWPNPTMKEINICIQDFLKEASCYELIAKHNASAEEKIHTPSLYYYGAFRMNVQDLDPIEGFYLLLSYIEEDETKITKSMVENGCRQLEMMGDIGIQHHDIANRNCKVADGNIVFLDFSHAKNREPKYDNSDDIHDLKYIFRKKAVVTIDQHYFFGQLPGKTNTGKVTSTVWIRQRIQEDICANFSLRMYPTKYKFNIDLKPLQFDPKIHNNGMINEDGVLTLYGDKK